MSCIYGWWNLKGQEISISDWDKVTAITSWWSPDTSKSIIKDNVALGHLGLNLLSSDSVVDPNTIHESAKCSIVADTRLDNRKEILKKLNLEDNSISDSYIILKLYLVYGERCVDHLIGAFSFMIYNENKDEFFGARDHIGIKPFNYYYRDSKFIFGSQPKSILAVDGVDTYADWNFITLKISRKMSVGDSTENLYIKKLLPAHTIKVTKDSIKTERYWNLNIEKEIEYKNEQDYVEHFLELFKLSIKDRMRGTQNVSAHLSGGLDSSGISAVAASLAPEYGKKFNSFSYTFPEKKNLKLPKGMVNFNPIVDKQVRHSNISSNFSVNKTTFPGFRKHIELESLACDGISWSNNVRTEWEIQQLMSENKIGVNLSGFLGDEIITSFVRPYYLEYLDKGKYFKFFMSKHRGKYQPLQLLTLFGLHIASKYRVPINNEFFARRYQTIRDKKQTRFINETHLFSKVYIDSHHDLKSALVNDYDPEIHQSIPLSLKAYQRNHIKRR